jgi:hypothetical protein
MPRVPKNAQVRRERGPMLNAVAGIGLAQVLRCESGSDLLGGHATGTSNDSPLPIHSRK